MAMFQKGFHIEDRIVSALESCGCTVQRDTELDHEHKIDFVVVRFPSNPKYYSLGVQVTSRLGDGEKLQEFVRINSSNPVTGKSMYLEISDGVNLERGGTPAILSIIMEFQFSRAHSEEKIGVATLYDDLTYSIQSEEKALESLRNGSSNRFHTPTTDTAFTRVSTPRQPLSPASRETLTPKVPMLPLAAPDFENDDWKAPLNDMKPIITGHYTTFSRDKGYGFIEGDDGQVYYAHINQVMGNDLREELSNVPYNAVRDTLHIPIQFKARNTRASARYPEAYEITRHSPNGNVMKAETMSAFMTH